MSENLEDVEGLADYDRRVQKAERVMKLLAERGIQSYWSPEVLHIECDDDLFVDLMLDTLDRK